MKSFFAGNAIGTAAKSVLADERLRLWWWLFVVYVGISTATRTVLAGIAISQAQLSLANLPAMMAVGLFFDVITAFYLFAPFAIYLVFVPRRIFAARWHRRMLAVAFAAAVFGLVYLGAVEYFFFDEFNSRFNFVAVEYLIYPHEVFVNIWQSYPVVRVLLAAFAITAAVVWGARG
ncbi:MAG: hypothetical protein ABI771_12450, partial [Betaproteobacteria bacterium]